LRPTIFWGNRLKFENKAVPAFARLAHQPPELYTHCQVLSMTGVDVWRIQPTANVTITKRAIRGTGEGLTRSTTTSSSPKGGLISPERISNDAIAILPASAPISVALTAAISMAIPGLRPEARAIISPRTAPYPAARNNINSPKKSTPHPATTPNNNPTKAAVSLCRSTGTQASSN
jgi:hypothetical protein